MVVVHSEIRIYLTNESILDIMRIRESVKRSVGASLMAAKAWFDMFKFLLENKWTGMIVPACCTLGVLYYYTATIQGETKTFHLLFSEVNKKERDNHKDIFME